MQGMAHATAHATASMWNTLLQLLKSRSRTSRPASSSLRALLGWADEFPRRRLKTVAFPIFCTFGCHFEQIQARCGKYPMKYLRPK